LGQNILLRLDLRGLIKIKHKELSGRHNEIENGWLLLALVEMGTIRPHN